jgi:tetratricopeptide (TPR) repeat protein
LRRGSLSRGEARLHLARGRTAQAKGQLDARRRELALAVAADPGFVDALYAAAAFEAISGNEEAALSLLRRAAEADPRRVEVLARDDESLAPLRSRPEVRKLLGQRRPPP